jgi:transposase
VRKQKQAFKSMTDLSKIDLTPKTLEEAVETIGHLAKIIIERK